MSYELTAPDTLGMFNLSPEPGFWELFVCRDFEFFWDAFKLRSLHTLPRRSTGL